MVSRFLFSLLTTLLTAGSAFAETTPPEGRFDFKQRGSAEYRFLGQTLYQAALYTPEGQSLNWDSPAGLALSYQRDFSGRTLMRASMAELRRMEGKADDHAEIEKGLADCFRDVEKGDRYLAVAVSPDDLEFWLNGENTCTLSGQQWAERFMAIWVSDQSRDQRSARLLRNGGN